MTKMQIIFGVGVAYIVTTTLVGSLASRKGHKDTASFMTAKNQLGPLVVGLLLMSEFIGTSSTIGTAQAAYEVGYSASWNLITLALGFFLYAVFMAPKYNALGEYTISGALATHFGGTVRALVSLMMVYALITVNVSVYTGGAAAIAKLLGIEITTAVFIVGASTSFCVGFGGLKGVGAANIIHVIFKYTGLCAIAWCGWRFMLAHPAAWEDVPARMYNMGALGWGKIGAWTVGNIGAIFSTQYVLQSINSLSSPKEAKVCALIAGSAVAPMALLIGFIGVTASVMFPGVPSIMALPSYFEVMSPVPAAIAVSGIIAATFVTALACTIGASALILKDLIFPFAKPAAKNSVLFTKLITFLVGIVPIPFALYVPGLLHTVFFARALRSSVAVLAVFMFYAPHFGSPKSATLAMLASAVLTTVWFFLGNPGGIDSCYVATVTPAAVIVADTLLFGKKGMRAKAGKRVVEFAGTPRGK